MGQHFNPAQTRTIFSLHLSEYSRFTHQYPSYKHQQIGTALQDTEADVFGMAELNLNFKVLPASLQWHDRFHHIRLNHSVYTYNKHDSSTHQTLYGGTAQISTGAFSHRASLSGTDESGMGRWV
jgi:hypothetical protein